MAFIETRFPTNISVGSRGGPKWRTVITQTQSGREQRLQKWSNLKAEYDVGYGVRTKSDLVAVLEFFNEMRGRAHSFRYKDYLDYNVTDEALVMDGSPTFQLIRTYGNGFNDYVRDIKKPVSGSVSVKKNAGAFTDYTIDTTTGILTFTASVFSVSITNITQAANAQVTTASAHSRSIGDLVYFTTVSGMTQINTLVGSVASIVDPTNFTVDIDTSAFSAYSGGGVITVYVEAGDTFTWTGEYDVPVRFADDHLDVQLDAATIGATTVRLEEVRL